MVSGKFYDPFELLSPCLSGSCRLLLLTAACEWTTMTNDDGSLVWKDFNSVSCRPTPTSTGFQVMQSGTYSEAELALASCFVRPFFFFYSEVFIFETLLHPPGWSLGMHAAASAFIVPVGAGCFIYSKHCLSGWVWRRRPHFTAHKTQVLVFFFCFWHNGEKWRKLNVVTLMETLGGAFILP